MTMIFILYGQDGLYVDGHCIDNHSHNAGDIDIKEWKFC